MDEQFRSQYSQRGRELFFMGARVGDLEPEDLHALIGYLFEKLEPDAQLALRQEEPLGAPTSDPPKNDGLFEG
jgi:hypothetical protein